MTEDFFSGLSSWWRESWQAGINQPAFGPKVGRGLFSNWFLTERDREIVDLEALYARVWRLREASRLAPDETRSELVSDIIVAAFKASQTGFSRPLLDALYDVVNGVLVEDVFWFPRYDVGDIARLPMTPRSQLRNFLVGHERFLLHLEPRLNTVKELLVDLSIRLLDVAATEEWIDDGEDENAYIIDVPLFGVADDVPELLSTLLVRLCADDGPAVQAELFPFLREQIMRNVRVASDMAPNAVPPTKPYRLPRDRNDLAIPELIETYLQYTPFQSYFESALPVRVPASLRTEHTLIVGGSGHGKTQLLLNLIHHDLTYIGEQPPGLIVIDSQGDLIRTISQLALFDPDAACELSDRLILIDPADVEFPVALNLFAFDAARLDGYDRAGKERVINSVIDLYEYFFAALLGAELTQKQGVVFRYLARLMLAIPHATVQTLRELMEDGEPYRPYMETLDGSAKRFFESEFFSRGFAATKKQILRRLWGVLANPVFERMFSHPENRIDLFEAMNDGKIVLINTAKDLLKSEGCSIFGRFFIAKIAQAAFERATIEEAERRTTYVYIDEAHDYFDETLEHLFNQARKYGVGLHVAAQHLDQMPNRLRSTVMASTSLKFAGGVSAKDARALADDMRTDASFIRSMSKRRGRSEFAAYVKGRTESALRTNIQLGEVNALPTLDDEQYGKLIDANRARYCATLSEIEAIIDEPAPQSADKERPVDANCVEPEAAKSDDLVPAPSPAFVSQEPRTEVDPEPSQPVEPKEDVQETRKEEIDRYVAGLGGRQHKQLQQLVRELAQERGFRAILEKPVLDGGGKVDIALEHDHLSIGVEVSVTTDVGHERRNLIKCLDAGFDKVVLVVPDPSRRAQFKNVIAETLAEDQVPRIFILAPDGVGPFLDDEAASLSSSDEVIRGWRVKTHLRPVSEDEAQHKREALGKIIAASIESQSNR
ncbi:type IV secretory system conjugative DNA transfer family protein [Maricaulis sp. CAU 1757]